MEANFFGNKERKYLSKSLQPWEWGKAEDTNIFLLFRRFRKRTENPLAKKLGHTAAGCCWRWQWLYRCFLRVMCRCFSVPEKPSSGSPIGYSLSPDQHNGRNEKYLDTGAAVITAGHYTVDSPVDWMWCWWPDRQYFSENDSQETEPYLIKQSKPEKRKDEYHDQ